MKKILLLFLSLYFTTAFTQTALSAGDFMFVGINSDPSGTPTADEFAVVFLNPITTGTEIYFTDMGYTGNAAPYFQQNANNGCTSGTGAVSDGMVKWTATEDVSAGTQLVIRVRITGVSGTTSNIGTVTVIVNPQGQNYGMSFSSGGEAIHAFQGTINGSNQVTSANILGSIMYDGDDDNNGNVWEASVTTCQFSSSDSQDPGTGFEVEFFNHFDNGFFSGSIDFSQPIADIQAAILDMNNWTRSSSNSANYPLPVPSLSVENFDLLENKIKLHPNPASNLIIVKNIEVEKAIVYDTLGRQVAKTFNNELNIENYKPGLYLMTIETSTGIITKRFVKK